MEMYTIPRRTCPSTTFGDDFQNPKNIDCQAGAPEPYLSIEKALLDRPQQFHQDGCASRDTSTSDPTQVTPFPNNGEVLLDSDNDAYSDSPTTLHAVKTGIYSVIIRNGVKCIGPPSPEESSHQRNDKTSVMQHLALRNNWYTRPKPCTNPSFSSPLDPPINDIAVFDSESDLDSGCPIDDYGIGGVDDQVAAKRRESTYRTDFTLPLEQCGSDCCGAYSDGSGSDCSSEGGDGESFENVEEGGGDHVVDVKLGLGLDSSRNGLIA